MPEEIQHAAITYTEIERKIDLYYQMQKITSYHELTVTPSKVATARKEFTLEQVLDVSYKPFSTEAGILYLHTHQGVFPFNIHTNPQTFIDAFKSFKSSKLRK